MYIYIYFFLSLKVYIFELDFRKSEQNSKVKNVIVTIGVT
jgi:hypothetical protein